MCLHMVCGITTVIYSNHKNVYPLRDQQNSNLAHGCHWSKNLITGLFRSTLRDSDLNTNASIFHKRRIQHTAWRNMERLPSSSHLCGFFLSTPYLQAIANESGINFISVKGPELLNMVYIIFTWLLSSDDYRLIEDRIVGLLIWRPGRCCLQ